MTIDWVLLKALVDKKNKVLIRNKNRISLPTPFEIKEIKDKLARKRERKQLKVKWQDKVNELTSLYSG